MFRTGLGKNPCIIADQYEAHDVKGVECFCNFGGGIAVAVSVVLQLVVNVDVNVDVVVLSTTSILLTEIKDALCGFGNNTNIGSNSNIGCRHLAVPFER